MTKTACILALSFLLLPAWSRAEFTHLGPVETLDNGVVTGVFATLNGVTTTLTQGSTFTSGGQQFQITYTASGFGGIPSPVVGNDVALLAVPEPGTSVLLGLGLGAILWRSRSRRHLSAKVS